jgi:hypothetical protein
MILPQLFPSESSLHRRRKGKNKIMGCDEYSASIQLYIDNELRGRALQEFQTHREACADCRKKVEAAGEPLQLLRLAARVRVSGLIRGFIFVMLCYLAFTPLIAVAWEAWRLLR